MKKNDMMKKNIVLIGFMGSGKTTLGLKLSWKLRMMVEDTDKMIESRSGKAISQIFETEGEEAFRRMETALLSDMATKKYTRIISVGGGTPVREENRPLLKRLGTVFYLRVQPETVYARIKGDTTRPLLQCDDPLGRITELLQSRDSAYEECADVIVDVDGKDAETIVQEIISAL